MVHPIWQEFPEISNALYDVREIMVAEVKISSPAVREKIRQYIFSPGKFIRSGLCLMFDQNRHGHIQSDKLYLAAGIEMLHLATLIHDDVIDRSDVRRGITTMHVDYDNRLAIYAGDYLLMTAGRLLAEHQIFDEDNHAFEWSIQGILNGEILQLMNQHNTDMTLNQYLKQIRGKTALLFAMATYTGYYDPHDSVHQSKRAFYIGEQIGMIFQLSDDLIDFQSNQAQSGKPQYQDVQNGIYTAPLLYAMDQNPQLKTILNTSDSIRSKELEIIQAALEESQAMQVSQDMIDTYRRKIEKRLRRLPGHDEYSQSLLTLLDLLIQRRS